MPDCLHESEIIVRRFRPARDCLRATSILVATAVAMATASAWVPTSGFFGVLGPPGASAAVTFTPGYGQGTAAECTRTIAAGSIEAAANALASGQVLCVRGGIFTETDKLVNLTTSGTAGAPKKIKAYPGERVELRGGINSKASYWVIEGLFVDASYSPSGPAPGGRINTDQAINVTGGTNVLIDSVELVNRNPNLNPDLAGTCLYVGGSARTNITVTNSAIHRCGQLPRSNHEHCVYAAMSSGLTIRDNWIYDCADRSIQVSPDTDNALIVGNLVDSDSQSGIDLDNSANNDVVRNNVVDTPNGKTIYTGRSYVGSGNAVDDNCVWRSDLALTSDVARAGNLVADPQIVGHTVGNSACAAKLPVGSPFRP